MKLCDWKINNNLVECWNYVEGRSGNYWTPSVTVQQIVRSKALRYGIRTADWCHTDSKIE